MAPESRRDGNAPQRVSTPPAPSWADFEPLLPAERLVLRAAASLRLGGRCAQPAVADHRRSFAAVPLFDGAHVRGRLTFSDCALPGLHAEGGRVYREIAITAGCSVEARSASRAARSAATRTCKAGSAVGEARFVGARMAARCGSTARRSAGR